jgi:hypothetical protein
MPYGSPAASVKSQPQLAPTPPSFASQVGAAGRLASSQAQRAAWAIPLALATLLILWLVWAVVELHPRLRDRLRPANVALNFRYIAVTLATVVIGINLLKVAAAKYKAWGLPGGDTIVALIGNA